MIGPKIKSVCEIGYSCGLKTLHEAIANFDIHYRQMLSPEQDAAEVEALNAELEGVDTEQLVVDILGAERCSEIDTEFDEWCESMQPDAPPADFL